MNIIKKLLFIIPAAGMLAVSCTDVEKMEVDHIGGYNTMNNCCLLYTSDAADE